MEEREAIHSHSRIDARDLKLLRREDAIAVRYRRTHRRCPCNICLGETKLKRTLATIRSHLAKYGRHPYHRGPTRGWEKDDSDTEWETSIRAGFGTTGEGFLEQFNATIDHDMDMATLVDHHFHTYDGIAGAIGAMPDPESSDSDGDEGNVPIADSGQSPIHEGEGMQGVPPTGQDDNASNQTERTGSEGTQHSIESEEEDGDDDVPAMEAALHTERELMEESARTPLYAGVPRIRYSSSAANAGQRDTARLESRRCLFECYVTSP